MLKKLLLAIYESLTKGYKYRNNNLEQIEKAIIEYQKNNEQSLSLNFYGVLAKIYKKSRDKDKPIYDYPNLDRRIL